MKKKRKCCMLLILVLLCCSAQIIWADAAVDGYSQEAVDYDVQVSAPDGGVNIRYGPGVEYDRLIDSMIPNGVILHVTSQAQASNGNYWGYTYYNGIYGWIALTQVSRIESVPTPAPATPEPVQLPSETPVVTAAPTEAVTPLVTEIPTVTPTAEPTETPSETKEPEKTPAPEEESKEEGITISYRLLIKILIGVCIVLIVLFTAIVLLLISKKR